MLRFYRNTFLLALINLGIFFIILFIIHIFFVQKHWQTDPDVFIIPDNQSYQFIILGTSHGQNFTRFSNQHIVENILGEHFFNLSQPNAGPLMEKIYLQYFLEQGNSAHTVIYFIDPQVFYTAYDNENYNILPLYGEVNLPMEALLIENNISFATQLSYVKTYLSFKWFIKNPRPNLPDRDVYVQNATAEKERLEELYPPKLQQKTFNHYVDILNSLILLCHEHHMKLVFIIPPTLIKNYPGMDQLKLLLKQYKQKERIQYYDDSYVLTDIRLYGNIDHLNTNGITVFTQKYLKPIAELQGDK